MLSSLCPWLSWHVERMQTKENLFDTGAGPQADISRVCLIPPPAWPLFQTQQEGLHSRNVSRPFQSNKQGWNNRNHITECVPHLTKWPEEGQSGAELAFYLFRV